MNRIRPTRRWLFATPIIVGLGLGLSGVPLLMAVGGLAIWGSLATFGVRKLMARTTRARRRDRNSLRQQRLRDDLAGRVVDQAEAPPLQQQGPPGPGIDPSTSTPVTMQGDRTGLGPRVTLPRTYALPTVLADRTPWPPVGPHAPWHRPGTYDEPTRVRLIENGTTISQSGHFDDRMAGFWETATRLAELDRPGVRAVGLGCIFEYRGDGIVDCRDNWFSDWRDLTVRVHPASGECWRLRQPPPSPKPDNITPSAPDGGAPSSSDAAAEARDRFNAQVLHHRIAHQTEEAMRRQFRGPQL